MFSENRNLFRVDVPRSEETCGRVQAEGTSGNTKGEVTMRWLKKLRDTLSGDWIDGIVVELKERTRLVSENTERLRQRAQMDGEDGWFLEGGNRFKKSNQEGKT